MYQILITLFIISIIPASAAGPSFDCKKAGSPLEIAICKSPELMTLDLELSELYKSKKDQEDEKALQKAWVKVRNEKCSGAGIEACLKEKYSTRIAQLKQLPQSTPAVSDPWKLIPPERESDYYSPELAADPSKRPLGWAKDDPPR